ncbi:MAG: hypothetical protein ACO1Q7_04415 [Gemmatimonas sp.]
MFLIRRPPLLVRRKPKLNMSKLSEAGAHTVSFEPRKVIGIAQVALGVLGLLNGLAMVGFYSYPGGPIPLMLFYAAILAGSFALVISGLWMSDGRRRGAYVSLVLNAVTLLLVLFIDREFSLAGQLAAAMFLASAYLAPTLDK